MRCWLFSWCFLGAALFLRAQLPPEDQRGREVRNLNTPRTFGTFTNLARWQSHQYWTKMQVLVSAGLWPLPEKTRLNEKVFGLIARDGYSVEKVYFESFPGVYVTGNLYRPLGRKGPFPAILNPHGHGEKGRLADDAEFSNAARCIQFARMGFIAFSYDMVGYNDACQFTPRAEDGTPKEGKFYDHHVALFRDPANQLWNLNVLGLQLWNSIRAVDFLQSLPDVNPQAIGCTGESGGGTQTFLLAAVDDRIKVSVPAVMVSHTMQGGCWCENAPGLRVQLSNLDFAAAAAPRHQLLIGATGDWTKTTLEVEAPAVARAYELYERPGNFKAVRFDFGHNYNQTSREAAYAWFAQKFQGKPADFTVKELPYKKEPDAQLRVFPDGKPPAGALSESDFVSAWTKARERSVEALRPTDPVTFTNMQRTLRVTLRQAMQLDDSQNQVQPVGAFGRPGKGDRIEKTLLMPDVRETVDAVVVLAHADGKAVVESGGKWHATAAKLVASGIAVLAFDAYQTGPKKSAEILNRSPFTNLFTTYNRTLVQERVQDVLTATVYARRVVSWKRVILVGEGEAGLWALLGGQHADAVIADADKLNTDNDEALIKPARFFPGLRLLGGAPAAAGLLAPKPLLLHNTGDLFSTDWIKSAYGALDAGDKLSLQAEAATPEALFPTIMKLAVRPK